MDELLFVRYIEEIEIEVKILCSDLASIATHAEVLTYGNMHYVQFYMHSWTLIKYAPMKGIRS